MIFEPIYEGFLDGVVSGVVGVTTPGLLTGSLRLAGLLRGDPGVVGIATPGLGSGSGSTPAGSCETLVNNLISPPFF